MAITVDYLSPRHPQSARSQSFEYRLRIARARPPVPAAVHAGTDSDVRAVLRRHLRRADRRFPQALQPPLCARRELHVCRCDRQLARHRVHRVGQLHRHGAAVTETSTGRSNVNGPFTRANGTLVQQAGTFLNGPDRDKGPSDLSLDHVLQVNGLVELPYADSWSAGSSGRKAGSISAAAPASGVLVDPDGDAAVNGIDVDAGRNAFTRPFLSISTCVSPSDFDHRTASRWTC